ncbi:MAG TPA: hypothetical protein VN455_02005 [Methanotrichaceae archaeon]|nr:hypothetical protein [Methanotrichaceae archaeon]
MVSIKDIPAEVRWEIATRSASSMPLVYDMIFRGAFGDKVDELETAFWVESGKEAKKIANYLVLPTRDAREIDDALGIISETLLGPEFKSEVLESRPEKVTERLTGCPMLNRLREMGMDLTTAMDHCGAYCSNAVTSMNPSYALEFTKGMCAGDPSCEYTIELKK